MIERVREERKDERAEGDGEQDIKDVRKAEFTTRGRETV